MKIGIIGTGQIGTTLVRRFTQAGYQVKMANSSGPQFLSALAQETGARAVDVREAVVDVDVIILSIPMLRVATLPTDLFANVPATTTVIDTGNYYPRQRDGNIAEIEEGMLESRWTESKIGHPVIKVFNNIYAEHLRTMGKPTSASGRIALPMAGDDISAKLMVASLVDVVGFDVVDAGLMDDSWRQQPGTPVYTGDFDVAGVHKALTEASPMRSEEWRATLNSPGSFEHPA